MSYDTDCTQSNARLSRITTHWSMLAEAHTDVDASASMRQALLERYATASYRYLLGAVRDEEAAEELCHELAVRFLRGDFHRANPERGRFRDYIKKTLVNLVNDFQRNRRQWPQSLPAEAQLPAQLAEAEPGSDFDHCFREELLARTWQALQAANPTYHALLQKRVFEPDLLSRDIAEELNRQSEKRLTAAAVRKGLERARAKFAELLLEEVSRASGAADAEDLRCELQQLDLLKYCRSAFERRCET